MAEADGGQVGPVGLVAGAALASRPVRLGFFGPRTCPKEATKSTRFKPLKIDVVSARGVLPWCYIGKQRIEERAGAVLDVLVEPQVSAPSSSIPGCRARGISREDYLTTKFGSVEAYKGIAGRVVAAAGEEGLTYRPELVERQPNTTDCHRLIHWAEAIGKAPEMKQRVMELYFRDGGDLTDVNVLVQAAADVEASMPTTSAAALATDEDVARISADAQEAAEKGISGVPTYVFAQKYAVSGAQDPPTCSRALSARCRRRSTRRRRSNRRRLIYIGSLGDCPDCEAIMKIKIVVHEAEEGGF